jgi:hypothetical protein
MPTMLRRLTRLLITALCTVLLVSLVTSTAEAGTRKPKVFGVTRAGQDWYHSKLLIKWRAVPASSYQMRWSWTPSKLVYSKVIRTGTSGGTYASGLHRGKTWYFQVRAIRSGVVGPWSKARGLRFVNAWPKAPTLYQSSLPGAVRFSWKYTPYASRYRVRRSAAWYGQWPGGPTYVDRSTGGWVSQTVRSSTYTVPSKPGPGDNYLAVDYANPVFAQIEANNGYRTGASQKSKWVAAFPTPPAPAPGDPVRMGTYNTMLFPTGNRARSIADNITAHGVTVVALQEANAATASAVVKALGSSWRSAPSGAQAQQQILYRIEKFSLLDSGKFNVPNPRDAGSPLVTPWARLSPVNPNQGHSQNFIVASVHFAENPNRSQLEKNRDTGLAAQAAMKGIDAANYGDEPVIVAGDLRYGREPYGDPDGYRAAQPTFVRAGYYDAMAAVKRVNSQYSVVNSIGGQPSAHQAPHPSGLGPRSDHILVKGFKGSSNYVNVVNWSDGGVVPSDHNLVYADVAIPYL